MKKLGKITVVFMLTFSFLVLLGASQFSLSYAKETLVVATWGGSWGESLRNAVAAPFEKEHNVKVVFLEGNSVDSAAKVRAQKMNPQIHVAMSTAGFCEKMFEEGLTLPITPDKVPNLNNLYPAALPKSKGYVAMYAYDFGFAYRTDKYDVNFERWSDLWKYDLKKRFGVPYPTYLDMHFLTMVAKVFGGSEYDIEPGFQKLKELKPQFGRMFTGDAEEAQLFASGEIWIAPFVSPEAEKLIEKGVPMKYVRPKDGIPAGFDGLCVVKNSPNVELAYKFVNFALNEKSQKGHAEGLFVIPMRKNVTVKPEVAKKLPTVEELDRLIAFDDAYINKNKDQWAERYNKEILSF
ncbi:MAG: ABC transporter substrate-binding protein [Desulfobacterales bacterium]|nr:ABC transporter substrate-binding protein [Nanoarchaeota archaeon]MCG2777891.1 ABC transporter substrate-binding protein [Desulfobacterales bacterium]